MKPAGERGAHSDVVVIVEVDDIAEVVVLVPAGAAAMAGPLVRPEAIVGCTQMQPLQQQAGITATAMAPSATARLIARLLQSGPWQQILSSASAGAVCR